MLLLEMFLRMKQYTISWELAAMGKYINGQKKYINYLQVYIKNSQKSLHVQNCWQCVHQKILRIL